MIETTYLTLQRAAEILKTDSDSLIIAGIEGRIQLYGLLGAYVTLSSGTKLIAPENPESIESYSEDIKQEWLGFFPIDRSACANLLKTGVSDSIYWVSAEHDEEQWQIAASDEEGFLGIVVQKSAVFIPRETVDQINTKGTPAKNAIPDINSPQGNRGHTARKNNNLYRVIAAMMDKLGKSADERGVKTEISNWTELNGARVGPDTVGKILKEATEIANADAARVENP